MANIQEIAEELCNLTAKEVELAMVMKGEYGIESSVRAAEVRERLVRSCRILSPREYGMSLINKRHRRK